MKRFSLFAIVIATGLAGCSAADWDNAMSFLPVEKPSQATMPAEASSPADPAPTTAAYSSTPPSVPAAAPADTAIQVSRHEIAARHCQAIAAQRSSDGAYMGMDEDAQAQEYKLTYANCMAWEIAHSE
jgi:hypothetical protein